jgi:hypothetical protein
MKPSIKFIARDFLSSPLPEAHVEIWRLVVVNQGRHSDRLLHCWDTTVKFNGVLRILPLK